MSKKETQDQHYLLIEAAINYLLEHHTEQPELAEIAAHAGLSEFYFQRLFVDWVGISPKRFLQFLTREHMKTLLDRGYSTMNSTYQVGLSGSGRSHELFVSTEAITPAQYKKLGKGLSIEYGFHSSPFGDYLLAITEKGICHISFVEHSEQETEATFKAEWCLATVNRNENITTESHQQLFSSNSAQKIKLLLRGTQFQIQVWQALLNIPFGTVSNYEKLAATIGKSAATRAAASAIAKNKIAYLIPCHRVIRKIGESGEFRWGKNRKKILLAYESAVSKF
ncbi:MAG: methylated-DNA--[protein]-cysteine S-methyltransferase [Gammaproteobacteria bacterium]|jgi:AraC family transcriptional regulator, regulatory protein of adaptative response / methylated-DNA-[protein]-cysteine methyltransferase|nr:methylated-DNA--[protein]-cysteine S-methyltransferase [Gammaproteobacteria bacterium]